MIKNLSRKWTVTWPYSGEEEDVDVCLTYDAVKYDPGRTYGPPEDCYPPEGGPEPLSLTINGVEVNMEDWKEIVDKFIEFALDEPPYIPEEREYNSDDY
jgi:hypothetical protein